MDEPRPFLAPFPVVAVASSAGGLHALTALVSSLPVEFPAAVVLVQHLDPRHPSHMAEILRGTRPWPCGRPSRETGSAPERSSSRRRAGTWWSIPETCSS